MRVVLLFALLSFTLASSGCAVLLVGAGATGGYLVAKDSRSAGTIIDDAAITGTVKAKFARDKKVNALEINIDTYDGVVTLHGHVHGRGTAKRAIALARSIKGVRKVESRLEVLRR